MKGLDRNRKPPLTRRSAVGRHRPSTGALRFRLTVYRTTRVRVCRKDQICAVGRPPGAGLGPWPSKATVTGLNQTLATEPRPASGGLIPPVGAHPSPLADPGAASERARRRAAAVSDGGARRPRLPARKQALWGGTATGPTFDRLGIPAGTHVAAAGVSRGHRGRG